MLYQRHNARVRLAKRTAISWEIRAIKEIKRRKIEITNDDWITKGKKIIKKEIR